MNSPSIGVAASFRDEHNALPGFLEMAMQCFDSIFLADASVDMTPSTDGSREIIKKFGLPEPPIWDLSAGFGAIRSQLVHSVNTDWVIVMDLDERFYVTAPVLKCEGTDRYPAVANPDLKVTQIQSCYNQKEFLMQRIVEAERRGIKFVRFSRRHWFRPGFTQPCENWNTIRDFQMRCMKARSGVGFKSETRMHEKSWDFNKNQAPEYVEDDPNFGPFLDHYHCFFKPMEPEQRAADIRAYDALHHSDTHTPIPTR